MAQITLPVGSPPTFLLPNPTSKAAYCKLLAKRTFDRACPPASLRRFITIQVIAPLVIGTVIVITCVYIAIKVGHIFHYLMTGASTGEDTYKSYMVEFILGAFVIVYFGFCIGAIVKVAYENCPKAYTEWANKEKLALTQQQDEERKKKEAADNAHLHRVC